jgi:hypothetical protein
MGNKPSSSKNTPEKEFENFYDVVDYIATYYILTMDFKSLSKLSEKEYCDKLIILTADILDKYLNEKHITYLEQRVKDGVEVNTVNNEKFLFINRDVFDDLDISNDTKLGIRKNIKKQRVCIGIAKFYVKIAHIFAAILMTINPIYSYTDTATGLTMRTTLMDKDKIPKGIKKEILKLNICDNRISALRNKELIYEETGKVTLQPNICDLNIGEYNMEKNLGDEPGIPELMQLYFDKYDDKTGSFIGMTEETELLFKKDLQKFYTAFTGNRTMPPEITRFSDIKLRDYNKQPNCLGIDPKFRSKVRISTKDDLFKAYAENIRNMIHTAANNQTKLLEVINELFTYTPDPKTQQKVIRVNPKLTEESLKAIIEKTRKYIMELYLKCEADFENGVKIYNAIVESKNAEILPRQIDTLSEESDKLVQSINPLEQQDDSFMNKEINENDKTNLYSSSKTNNIDSLESIDSSYSIEPEKPYPIEPEKPYPIEPEKPYELKQQEPINPDKNQMSSIPQINAPLRQQMAGKKRYTRKNKKK